MAEHTGNDGPPRHRYTAAMAGEIESRWQERWASGGVFRQPNPGEPGFDASRPKFYCLDMFPYPSGAGLHVGHPEGYTATDIMSRYKRMRGFNVLHPMGWDAFGLPAEQYAIQTGVHPAITTRTAIDNFRRQLQRFGFSYDWSREFGTIDPEYYRWTQWVFLKLYDAWFDEAAGKARPIADLVRMAVAGQGQVATPIPYRDMGEEARREFLDSRRLAYRSEMVVNWCPKLGTVLANDEVIDGRSERGGHPVVRRPLRQWVFRITAYAERLLNQLADLEWPESTKAMQAEWIGRSEGAEIEFVTEYMTGDAFIHQAFVQGEPLRVFTTRPDTLFGATYMVVASEHPMCAAITDPAVTAYIAVARGRSDIERQESKEKNGVFTGVFAVNPATRERIPVWVADYVLMGYGTGAIMAVPGHDERDAEFARKYDLPIREVVKAPRELKPGEVFTGEGVAINSSSEDRSLDGMPTAKAKAAVIEWVERGGIGRGKVNYKLRDWVFSRQRYWGEPFPIVYDGAGRAYPIMESHLPVRLPELADYAPIESDVPQPLLAKAGAWVQTTAGAAGVDPALLDPATPVTRETNTMPGSAGSSWYAIRYCDARNGERFVGREAERYWMGSSSPSSNARGAGIPPASSHPSPVFSGGAAKKTEEAGGTPAPRDGVGGVDLYVGGSEHAVGHLLYARFWQNVLFDLGEVSTPEPYRKLFHQGLITSFAYQREDKTLVPVDAVSERSEGMHVETATGKPVKQITAKMSKSLKNVVNPDDVIAEFGADTFRLYEMYMGPLEASKPWNPRDITGLHRFLQRAWRMLVDEATGATRLAPAADDKIERHLHRLTAKVGHDIERLSLNTAIAAMIEFVNAASGGGGETASLTADQGRRFALLLCPFAPHMGEELWAKLGATGYASGAAWPAFDDGLLRESHIEVPVSVMGKVRARVMVAADADAAALEAAALAEPKVQELIAGKTIKKVIVVPGKMVNVVV